MRAIISELAVRLKAALGPQAGALQCILLVAARVEQRGELVEGEDNVRTQLMLDAH